MGKRNAIDAVSKKQFDAQMAFIDSLPNMKQEDLEDKEKALEYLAMLCAICLDEDPTFINRVASKRRRFIDRLLVDSRLM